MPPPPQYAPPPQLPTPKKWYQYKGALIALGVVAIMGIGALTKKADPEPGPERELCAILRDPSVNLTKGDYMRMADWEDWQLQRYVAAKCPEQYDRVD